MAEFWFAAFAALAVWLVLNALIAVAFIGRERTPVSTRTVAYHLAFAVVFAGAALVAHSPIPTVTVNLSLLTFAVAVYLGGVGYGVAMAGAAIILDGGMDGADGPGLAVLIFLWPLVIISLVGAVVTGTRRRSDEEIVADVMDEGTETDG